MIVTLLILFIAGACLGSFVNALVWRLKHKRDWVTERSECPHCHHVLAPKDLVPIASWLYLRGKCRYCKKPIPDSPLVELVLGLLLVISYAFWPMPLSGDGLFTFACWVLFLVGFMALALYDLKWFLLPDKIVFSLLGLAVVQLLVVFVFFGGPWQELLSSAIGAAVISGLFYAIFQISKGKWIGFGDVKLGLVLGLLAGSALQSLMVLFVASLLGTLISIPFIVTGKASRKSYLPFGPLLIAGLFIVVIFGDNIVSWYSGIIMGV